MDACPTAIAQALDWACHGFVCCAEPGVEPVLDSFISNTFEMAREEDPTVTEAQVRDYVTLRWSEIVANL